MSATYKLLKDSGNLIPSPTEYRALVGSLQYLSLTRPDIAFNTNKLVQFMQNPRMTHWTALKRVLGYLAGDKDDYISTTGYLLYLGNTPTLGVLENNVLLLDRP
ncbi:hypothetical protein KIW84_010556 [Lathyrus oleraceus]|uniref:Retrovirus-related Pol polyprotein from transposon TNT 1-94 n=1 Tax=Pisum sativum TaxID=3888 RepID=A0A9D4YP43_PEA|nr:hypothetical protein KIW84_010556 [Pisum sativum]